MCFRVSVQIFRFSDLKSCLHVDESPKPHREKLDLLKRTQVLRPKWCRDNLTEWLQEKLKTVLLVLSLLKTQLLLLFHRRPGRFLQNQKPQIPPKSVVTTDLFSCHLLLWAAAQVSSSTEQFCSFMAELKKDFRFKMVEHNVFLNHFKIVWTSRDLLKGA